MRTPQHFLPSTFEERGTTIPFTTAVLGFARVRKDYRDRLEILIPRFANADGTYVVPWSALPELIALTTHDTVLYEAVGTKTAINPRDMRQAALAAAKTGLAGPAAAEAATKALADDEENKALAQVLLILKVIEGSDPAAAAQLMRDITKPEGQDRVRQTLFDIADKLDIEPALLDSRMSELGGTIHDVGVSFSPIEGRLRTLIRKLGEFSANMMHWATERMNEAADQARVCAEVASHTIDVGMSILKPFDKAVGLPHELVSAWDSRKAEVERLATRLDWLLDGWSPLVEWWSEVQNEEEGDQISAIDNIVAVLPLIPRGELPEGQADHITTLMGSSRRWVRINEDWRTGSIDPELQQRYERLKTKAA